MISPPPYGSFANLVTQALSSFGVSSRLAPAGAPESMAGDGVGGISTAIVRVDRGPIAWINVQASLSGDGGRPDMFSLLYGVADPRILPELQKIEIRLDLKVGNWEVKGRGISDAARIFGEDAVESLKLDEDLNARLRTWGSGISIKADSVVDSWVIAARAGKSVESAMPTQDRWKSLQAIAFHLLRTKLPGGLTGIRVSQAGAARAYQWASSQSSRGSSTGRDEPGGGDGIPIGDIQRNRVRSNPPPVHPRVRSEPPKRFVSKPDHDPDQSIVEQVEEKYGPYFDYLTDQGLGPRWEWVRRLKPNRYPSATSNTQLGKITLESGPVEEVLFGNTTVVTHVEEPHEAPSYADEWMSVEQVAWKLKPDWLSADILGIHRLSLKPGVSSSPEWRGDDVGLGVLENLNRGSPISGLPASTVVFTSQRGTPKPSEYEEGKADLHKSMASQLVLSTSENTAKYKKSNAPEMSWPKLDSSSQDAIQETIERLIEGPKHIPTSPISSRDLVRVPIPGRVWIEILIETVMGLLFTAAALAAFNVDWDGRPVGWMVFFGIVLSVIAVLFVGVIAEEIEKISAGCFELSGPIEHMWETTPHTGNYLLKSVKRANYLRVRDRPFEVEPGKIGGFGTGDKVVVMYWGQDLKIEEIRSALTVSKYTSGVAGGGK